MELDLRVALKGQFGVIGELYGAVDFSIVKASVNVNILAAIGVQILLEAKLCRRSCLRTSSLPPHRGRPSWRRGAAAACASSRHRTNADPGSRRSRIANTAPGLRRACPSRASSIRAPHPSASARSRAPGARRLSHRSRRAAERWESDSRGRGSIVAATAARPRAPSPVRPIDSPSRIYCGTCLTPRSPCSTH